jgi:AcrR family transcriptional regulator
VSEPARVPRGSGRDALCAALVRVVARDGLDGVTFRSVAAEAGVTHGLASYHFGTRDEMIREALSWATRRAIQQSDLGADAATIDAFATLVPQMIDEHPDESLFQFHLALAAIQRPDLLAEVRGSYDGYIQTVREALERLGLGDDPALARVVFAAADGLSLQQLLFDNRAEIEDAVRALQRLLRAVAKRNADRG